MAVGQNQWLHVGVGAPPMLVYFSVDWDVHWGYGILTHSHVSQSGKTPWCTSGQGPFKGSGYPFHLGSKEDQKKHFENAFSAEDLRHQCQYAAALAPGCCLHPSFPQWRQNCELLGCAGCFSAPVSTVSCMTLGRKSPRTSSEPQLLRKPHRNLQKRHKLFRLKPRSGEAGRSQVD